MTTAWSSACESRSERDRLAGKRPYGCSLQSPAWSGEFRNINPAPLFPALDPKLGKLYPLGSFAQRPSEGFIQCDVPEEQFPLYLERIVIVRGIRDLLPAAEKVDRL